MGIPIAALRDGDPRDVTMTSYVRGSDAAAQGHATVVIPAKAFARDYVITGVGLSVCLSVCLFVCYHDN